MYTLTTQQQVHVYKSVDLELATRTLAHLPTRGREDFTQNLYIGGSFSDNYHCKSLSPTAISASKPPVQISGFHMAETKVTTVISRV